jgi:hypothetical protein
LGVAALAYIFGIFLWGPHQSRISQILFALSAVLASIGIFYILPAAGYNTVENSHTIAGLLALVFLIAWFFNRKPALTFIILLYIIFGAYAGIQRLYGGNYESLWARYSSFGIVVFGLLMIMCGTLISRLRSGKLESREV